MRFLPIILIFTCQSLIAQAPYNHRLENGQIQAIGQLVHELEDSYLGIGRGIDTIDFLRGIYATEFDKETGEILNTDKITYPNSLLFFNRGNNVLEIDNKPYFLFHRSDTIYLSTYSDVDNKIILEKKIVAVDPVNSLFIYDFQYNNDIFYILSYHTSIATGDSHPILFTHSLESDSLDEHFLNDNGEILKHARIQILDSGNVLLTYSIKVGNENVQFLEEIDLEGNTIWKYTNENARESFVNSFIPMSDSTYILGGVKSRDDPNSSDNEVIPYILKFNYNQRKITARSDFEIPEDEWFWRNGTVEEIVASHDGQSFLCVSELYDFPMIPDMYQSRGMIAKVDHDLNLIWRRQFAYIAGDYNVHYFEDIIATSDGNYLAYGTSEKTFSNPGETPILSWAIKIDEDGKIVGDTTTATVEWEDIDLVDQIEIFPNPATDHIYINQNEIEDVSYRVFDLNGRWIETFTLSDKNQSIVKSIEKWATGYNIVQLVKDGKPIGSLKVLKL